MNNYLNKNFPIWRDSRALLVEIEGIVRNFARFHKYTVGSELRLKSKKVHNHLAVVTANVIKAFKKNK